MPRLPDPSASAQRSLPLSQSSPVCPPSPPGAPAPCRGRLTSSASSRAPTTSWPTNEQIVSYFHALDAASDRVVVEEIGKSVEGRPMILAIISSEANIKNLANATRTSAGSSRSPAASTKPQARTLAKEGKAIVWIDGGLHATEVAHAQHMPELAWWLATSEDDEATADARRGRRCCSCR